MADKRQSMVGKTVTAKPANKEMGDQDFALGKAVGARIRITAAPNNRVLEGTLFTACPITNTIALNTAPPPPNPSSAFTSQPGDYHIIPASHIISFQLLGEPERSEASALGFEASFPSLTKIDLEALKAREEATIQKLKQKDALRLKGIGKDAQEIFEALARTLPCRWHETSIVVNDAVMISKPYRIEDCAAPKDQQRSLNQVRKILEGFFARKRGAATSQAPSPAPPAPVAPVAPVTGSASAPTTTTATAKPTVATPIAPRKGG